MARLQLVSGLKVHVEEKDTTSKCESVIQVKMCFKSERLLSNVDVGNNHNNIPVDVEDDDKQNDDPQGRD